MANITSIAQLLDVVPVYRDANFTGIAFGECPNDGQVHKLAVDRVEGHFVFHLFSSLVEAGAFAKGLAFHADDDQVAIYKALPDGRGLVVALDGNRDHGWLFYDYTRGDGDSCVDAL